MSAHDGGPAFPAMKKWQADEFGQASNTGYFVTEAHGGMSLRDYFAAQAMAASVGVLMTKELMPHLEECSSRKGMTAEEYIADGAYTMADAMLKARKS